ncbi:MAG: VOC family protein [Chloroflexi bacterium]|nr:VOC family protein [Chloroflexota bacterium]
MLTAFDHLIIIVNDLAAAMETYRTLGFAPRVGGEHPAFGSHNALVALNDGTYLELLAFKDKTLAAQSIWRDAVQKFAGREGFAGYALFSDDLTNDISALRGRHLDVGEPNAGARVRPDGQRVAWRSALIGGSATGALPFMIQDDTPRTLRIEPLAEGLGSRVRAKEIVVAVKDADLAQRDYHALLDLEPRRVHTTAGDLEGARFSMPWGALVLAQPNREGNALADQLAQRGEGLYALTLAAADVNRERSTLVSRGVRVEDDARGFLIAPEFACGARLRLVGA